MNAINLNKFMAELRSRYVNRAQMFINEVSELPYLHAKYQNANQRGSVILYSTGLKCGEVSTEAFAIGNLEALPDEEQSLSGILNMATGSVFDTKNWGLSRKELGQTVQAEHYRDLLAEHFDCVLKDLYSECSGEAGERHPLLGTMDNLGASFVALVETLENYGLDPESFIYSEDIASLNVNKIKVSYETGSKEEALKLMNMLGVSIK